MPASFYTQEIENYQSALKATNKKLLFFSMLRLTVFLLAVVGIYFFSGNWTLITVIAIICTTVFLGLVSHYSNLQYEKKKTQKLIEINQNELRFLKRDYHEFDTGEEFSDANHFYSYDIDLFGKGSFFQYLNRTATPEGKKELAEILLHNDPVDIEKKQRVIKDLASKPKWRQVYSAIANLIESDLSTKTIVNWIKGYQSFTPKYAKPISIGFSIISLGVITTAILNIIPESFAIYWFFIGLTITGRYFKKTNLLSDRSGKAKEVLQQYHQLLNLIEEASFSAEILKAKQVIINSKREKASGILKKLSKAIDSLDQRNNMLFGVLANGFLLWDLRHAKTIEEWIHTYKEDVDHWFEIIAYIDAQNSLATFAYNHSGYHYPTICDKKGIEAKGLGHPLLNPENRVDNNFNIQNKEFFIVTGANMAGKSTFLRTVSLSIVMANCGLPVCASSFDYSPMKLITSMRTSDSLADGASYFFSELQRLKFIVEAIKTSRYFIILDEILKGTNSTDKAMGSRKLVERLVKSNATGIIATHDLSLCKVAQELDAVKNYYFDAIIANDELSFSYELKEGICQNMNASFLLKHMDIVE
ncbi:MutS-related protein [Zhouia amylolytica]|uniref:Transmembrane MutS family DNA mismatch repair protein n=1 Tax=Zhouia amylolytica AD3 TaxID=1286632 RepID=W2UIC2_9FLAO|nr:hypothetical protein [Zhouia amylolytica]ETN93910.1 transmembrane MutS family DNA mismatch repair protein [Zhouia amylolytica AD3]